MTDTKIGNFLVWIWADRYTNDCSGNSVWNPDYLKFCDWWEKESGHVKGLSSVRSLPGEMLFGYKDGKAVGEWQGSPTHTLSEIKKLYPQIFYDDYEGNEAIYNSITK